MPGILRCYTSCSISSTSSPEPVNSALALFGELVDEMEQLV